MFNSLKVKNIRNEKINRLPNELRTEANKVRTVLELVRSKYELGEVTRLQLELFKQCVQLDTRMELQCQV